MIFWIWHISAIVTVMAVSFSAGYYFGRNRNRIRLALKKKRDYGNIFSR
jgi:hypothetical protein